MHTHNNVTSSVCFSCNMSVEELVSLAELVCRGRIKIGQHCCSIILCFSLVLYGVRSATWWAVCTRWIGPVSFLFSSVCVVLPTANIYIYIYYTVLLIMIISVSFDVLPFCPPVCLFLGLCFLSVLCGLLPGLLCYGYFHFWSQVPSLTGIFFSPWDLFAVHKSWALHSLWQGKGGQSVSSSQTAISFFLLNQTQHRFLPQQWHSQNKRNR